MFLTKNGKLILEAESAKAVGDWKQTTVDGEKSLLWDADRSSYGKVPTGQTLSYEFRTDEGGSYNIALHSARVKSVMNASDRFENGKERTDTGNDAYVSLINAQTGAVVQKPTKLFTGLGNSDKDLKWGTTFDANHKKSAAQVNLAANTEYRLEITGRSDGYALDRITLSNDGVLRDTTSPESSQGGGGNPSPKPKPKPTPTPGDPFEGSLASQFDQIIFHFDGNNNDKDDIAALPMAAAITASANLQDKMTFFYGNNLSEPNSNSQVKAMRTSAELAEKLGIDAHSYQDGINQTTNKLVKILDSGQKVLAIEGGPMEAIYRALQQTSPKNRGNVTLLSHSSWNENRAAGNRPGGGKPRTWSDLRRDFPEVKQIDIRDQNGSGDSGFNSSRWTWLDNTQNPVLQEARDLMENAQNKVNDPSDAGMLYYALTGDQGADPNNARQFFDQYPPSFDSTPGPSTPPKPPTPPTPGQELITFALVNAETDQYVKGFEDLGADGTINLNGLDLTEYNIVAKVNASHPDAKSIKSVKFESPLGNSTESVKPFAAFGDNTSGDFYGKPIETGSFTLKASAYTEVEGKGKAVGSANLDYQVVDVGEPKPKGTAIGEYGSLNLNHEWQTVKLDDAYDNPVVVVSDPTLNGGDPAAIRLQNVGKNSFQVRLQEPNYEDGTHTSEAVSYVVMEAGNWKLSDGTRIAAGTRDSSRLTASGFDAIGLKGFQSTPTVLSQVQSSNGSDWVTTRMTGQSAQGFQVAMQEEEALNSGTHTKETVGWLAVDQGVASDGDTLLQAKTTGQSYSDDRSTVKLEAGFDMAPSVIAKLGSFAGSDTANLRLDDITTTSFGVGVHEEQSLDAELSHANEAVSFLALEGKSGTLTGIAA